jgi:hypothetical protein
METESVAKRAIALLTERGAMRTAQIAETLGVPKGAISSSLGPYVNNGTLTACKVESPGTPPTNEWRISAGGKTTAFRELKVTDKGKKTPPVPAAAAAAAKTPATPKRAYKRRAPVRKVQRKTATSAGRPGATGKAGVLRMKNAALRIPCADAGSFRAAVTSDGAMLFLRAAAGEFELNRAEARALVDFVRTLDHGVAAA